MPKYINTIKTITSREIRKNFPEVKTIMVLFILTFSQVL
ncbi:hypothetical protein [Methanosarcina sp. WH1]